MKKSTSATIIGAIIGLLSGFPLSYYFQPEMIRQKLPFDEYLKHFDELMKDKMLSTNIIMSCVAFAIVGGIIAFFISKNNAPKV